MRIWLIIITLLLNIKINAQHKFVERYYNFKIIDSYYQITRNKLRYKIFELNPSVGVINIDRKKKNGDSFKIISKEKFINHIKYRVKNSEFKYGYLTIYGKTINDYSADLEYDNTGLIIHFILEEK